MNQTNKSPQQLKSELTLLKVITISISAVLFLLLAIVIYGMLTKPENKTFIALLAVPLSLAAIIPINVMNMNKIKKQLNDSAYV